MTAIMIAASIIALLVYFAVNMLGKWSVEHWYLAERAQHRRNNAIAERLQEDLKRAPIRASDSVALQEWVLKREFVSLVGLLPGQPYEVDPWGTTERQERSDLAWDLSRMDYDFYPITFADGEVTVAVAESSEMRLYQIGNYFAIAAAVAAFIIIMLFYSRWNTQRIRVLSEEVNAVSHGALDHEIVPRYRDEISSLARDVENMRSTIIQRTRSEQSALQANSELITALSHDIRNPLTALIGYLELLEMDLDALPEQDRL